MAVIGDLTKRLGADVSIEAVHLEREWIRDITITTGLVDTSSIPTLIRLVSNGQLSTKPLITHHLGLDELEQGYDIFARAAGTGALKVVLSR